MRCADLSPRVRLVAALALLAASPIPAAHSAADADAVPFALTGRYQLRVGDEVVRGASLYLTERGMPRVIVSCDRVETPLLVVAGEKKASALAAGVLGDAEDRIVLTPASLAPGDRGVVPVRMDGPRALFDWAGQRFAIEPREPMLGPMSLEAIMDALPEYRRNVAEYKPQIGTIRLLGKVETAAQVQVFFGSWCPHCERLVPRLIKVIEELDSSKLDFRFHGVPRSVSDDPIARQYKVGGLPALILLREGAPPVRLDGEALLQPEMALAGALFGEP